MEHFRYICIIYLFFFKHKSTSLPINTWIWEINQGLWSRLIQVNNCASKAGKHVWNPPDGTSESDAVSRGWNRFDVVFWNLLLAASDRWEGFHPWERRWQQVVAPLWPRRTSQLCAKKSGLNYSLLFYTFLSRFSNISTQSNITFSASCILTKSHNILYENKYSNTIVQWDPGLLNHIALNLSGIHVHT